MLRLILSTLLLALTLGGGEAKAFETKHRTDHVNQEERCTYIQQRVGNFTNVDVNKFNVQGIRATYERMQVVLGKESITCKLTLKPDGSILDLQILKSSGSTKNDDKALKLVRSAGPFVSSKQSVPLAYIITFPKLNVTPYPL